MAHRRVPAPAALAGVFFLLGFVGASWLSRIPAVQADLGLGNAALGATLVGVPVGSALASLAMPALVGRFGSRRVVSVALPASAAALVPVGLAGSPVALATALVGLGAATGGLDVAMNTHGVAAERDHGRSVFGRLHAMWSLGGFAGAGVGVLFARAGVGPARHLLAAAAIAVVLGVPLTARLGAAADPSTERAQRRWSTHPAVIRLALVCVAAFVVEVVAADWGGVFLHGVLGASTSLAAAAVAAFMLPHFLVRLLGDPLVDRSSTRVVLAGSLGLSAAGLAVVAASTSAPLAFAGFAVAGGGIGLVVPVAFSAAGRVPGVAAGSGVSTAAGLSYFAWVAAPPLVGGLSAGAGLRAALLVAPAAAVGGLLTLVRRQS